MQLHVIIEIVEFIKQEVESKQIIAKYELLLAIIKKIANSPDKDFSDELGEVRNSVIQTLKKTEPENWSYSKYKLYLDLDKDCIIGERAIETLSSIFNSNQANPSGMTKEIKKIIGNLNKAISANTSALEILSGFSVQETDNQKKPLLTLFFEGKTSVNTIQHIERNSRIWYNIIVDFANLTMHSDCETVVESIDKKSIILHIVDGDKILESLSYAATKIIDTYSRILRIRKIQLEALQMTLNPVLKELFDEEIANTINDTSYNVVMELMEMNNWDGQNEKDIVFNRVQQSLKLILDFIEKGGKIECQLTKNSDEITERNKMLLSAYKTVSQIEDTVKDITLYDVTEESQEINL